MAGLSGHSWLPEIAPFILPWEAGKHCQYDAGDAVGLDGVIKAALWEVLLLISRKAEEPCDGKVSCTSEPQWPSGWPCSWSKAVSSSKHLDYLMTS